MPVTKPFTCADALPTIRRMAPARRCSNPGLPVHFISGGEDPCRGTDKELKASSNKMRKAGYANVDVKIYPGMRHEILNETGREQVWKDILK